MRRTQLYLEDEVWKKLHVLARQSHTTVSDLVRTAVREKYLRDPVSRKQTLLSAVGLWKDRTDLEDVDKYVRELRKGSRLESLLK